LLFFELFQGKHRIDRNTVHSGIRAVVEGDIVTYRAQLLSAGAGESQRKKQQQHGLAALFAKCHGCFVSIPQCKVGCGLPNLYAHLFFSKIQDEATRPAIFGSYSFILPWPPAANNRILIRPNVSLQPYNTFGINATAELFTEINDEQALEELSRHAATKHILGGGSNILLTGNVGGLVVLNRLKGIEIVRETEEHVWLQVASGEVWHQLVLFAIGKGWGGIENLALIPGTAGASPMQNIGAYGAEARDVIESVSFWHWTDHVFATLANADCNFGYRDSIFKHQLKDKVFITSVTYRLAKNPVFNTSYGAIEQELAAMKVTERSVQAITQAVINIRTSKLPDPAVIGNAGSFFKNPTIPAAQFAALQQQFPAIPSYPAGEGLVKVPAGWLIEQCGWKGARKGDAGVHARQALVLVNYGKATGQEIWQLSGQVVASVQDKFGIGLEREVQVW